jgi:glycosyltransferase involved in cell wall biosynthesis
MSEHECYIVTHDHDLFEEKKYTGIHEQWNDRGNCKVLYVSDDEYNKNTFENVIIELHPDIIYLQGLFQSCVLPCLKLAKKYNISVLLAPRGELCAGALNIKKFKKILYIFVVRALGLTKNINWQSTSNKETDAIKLIMKADTNQIHRIDNIPSIPKKDYGRREKIAGKAHFVFLSRIHPKKNLLSAIKYFHSIDGIAKLDIYGPIEDEEYWKQCQQEISNLPENIKVEYRGLVNHEMVHEVFSMYDAFLFPTLSENYGHVIAESLIVGTPVIISDQTPWNDVNEFGAGWAISLDKTGLFVDALNSVILESDSDAKKISDSVLDYIYKKMQIGKVRNQIEEVLLQIKDK